MAEESGGEKVLPASAQKLRKARDEGNIARSQDLASGIALAMALIAIVVFGSGMLDIMLGAGRYYLGNAAELAPDQASLVRLASGALWTVAITVLPVALVLVASGILVNLFQVGFLVTTKPMTPKFSRVNPISGFKRFFALRTFVELIKSIFKLILVVTVVWFTLRGRLDDVLMLMVLTPTGILNGVASLVFDVWWRIAAVMVVLGLFDYAYQRWQHLQDQRMTHQESRQENKELEGNPEVKRRVRQLQRQMATQRMMQDVPEADVIITNPVRYAVALRYDMAEMETPVVVAKGARKLAERIREVAAEHDVPIVRKPELARALHRSIEVGDSIPEDLFRTVAEVLSYVYRIDRRREKIREREAAWAAPGGVR